ncbi:MAG: CoA pyrophosphatase [Dehalococcoidia bacterium]|nr:CoA pyrophosphatase [Dehalococcoidia bacterium]MDW8119946.1 CoA pyrophosphatase [Chloroflexota bacterium]
METTPFFQRLHASLHPPGALTIPDEGLAPSAVLLVLYSKEGLPHLLLNRRTDLVAHHKGEMCFPGGAAAPEDKDLLATALRETQEEMGIHPADVQVLGALPWVRTRSRFAIFPFVGIIPYPYPFRPSPVEIAEVVELPVPALLDPTILRHETHVDNGRVEQHLSYAYRGRVVYGATARILTAFLTIASQALGREPPWTGTHRSP